MAGGEWLEVRGWGRVAGIRCRVGLQLLEGAMKAAAPEVNELRQARLLIGPMGVFAFRIGLNCFAW